MNSSPDDFKDLRRLLALKRHEQPPPGYFTYLPDQIQLKIERRDDLSEHSTWWTWLVERFDARPVLAGAYACVISGLMLLGVKVSRDLQASATADHLFPGFAAEGPHPLNFSPSERLKGIFANPVELINFTSGEFVYEEPEAPFPDAVVATFPAESAIFAQ